MTKRSAWRVRKAIPEAHRGCDSRIGDSVRDLRADPCLSPLLTYTGIVAHLKSHGASEQSLRNLWLAFHFPSTPSGTCAQDPREACYVADPNAVVHAVRRHRVR